MQLKSYVMGHWHAGERDLQQLRDATTGQVIAEASTVGIHFAGVLAHARRVGGPALRRLTFHERAALLKALAKRLSELKEEFYTLSFSTGATRADSWIDIDGGIGTLFAYASRGVRELPNSHVYVDGEVEPLSKTGSFVGQHVCVPREGAALHINAFNFPVWGMLEKLAPTLLAGVPAIIKPATATAYLAELVFRRIVESGLLPEGAVQLVCGSCGDLLTHLTGQDVVSFTGSAATANQLRSHPAVIRSAVRFIAETDSINACVLGADVKQGDPEFGAFVREVVREMTAKAGQKCTAIRKALVPAARLESVTEAIRAALGEIIVGDPRREEVRMGPLATLGQRREVLGRISELRREADLVSEAQLEPLGADFERGAFIAPTLLIARDPARAQHVHTVEAFGPVCTILPYAATAEAVDFARRGEGSLVASVFTADEAVARELALGLAPWHGRLLFVDRDCVRDSTGHGAPLPGLVHGGPGRAGGGEEMGGLRGVMHYMQRTALQGSPGAVTAITGRWVRGAREIRGEVHPFRRTLSELTIGETLRSGERAVTLEDIERFAQLTGDTFYAHMDEAAARRNPLFGGRVAHGYLLIAAAAGLFVDPPYGPVLANYGLERLRFAKPVRPGDRIKVRLTCKSKTLRAEKGYGEVVWDTQITNQHDDVVASYDVLTMVSTDPVDGG